MTDKFNMDRLNENDELTTGDQQVGSFRTNSFFELYNNQNYIKNDLNTRKQSSNRSEEDEEKYLENNLDDLNFDDLDDFGINKERNEFRSTTEIDSNDDEDDEELDKFDEEENNENQLTQNDKSINNNFNNAIPINQRFRKNRSNSNRISEDGTCDFGSSFKQLHLAKSLPVSIPNIKPFNSTNSRNKHQKNHRDKDNDENWFSVKEKGENIAESIKQLANSVRDDDYELFGDLPSRKFNTSDLIYGFK